MRKNSSKTMKKCNDKDLIKFKIDINVFVIEI
jgi:hypothetical protein